MNELLLQLGVGGIFAILLLREILPHLKRGDARTSGEHSTDFWKSAIRQIVDDSFADLVKPTLEAQSKILSELRDILREEQLIRKADARRRRTG